jgi:hypothetical protein
MTEDHRERNRSALATLSAVGAALAGVGVGALLWRSLLPLAWLIVGVGIISHLVGMVGVRRLLAYEGYNPPRWQRVAYWLCWIIISVVVVAGVSRLVL